MNYNISLISISIFKLRILIQINAIQEDLLFIANLIFDSFHDAKAFFIFICVTSYLDADRKTFAISAVALDEFGPSIVVFVAESLLVCEDICDWHHS